MLTRFALALAATSALVASPAHAQPAAEVPRPAALTVQAVPPVPAELAARTRPYMELRSASFAGWNRADRSMLTSWSQPTPAVRSAIRRTSASVGSNAAARASTTTKSLPRPFIFTYGRAILPR